jgi:branched-chain amino acid transport system permease protein
MKSKVLHSPKALGFGTSIVLLLLVPVFVKNPYFIHIFILAGVNVILASSLRLVDTSGQLSFGHIGFMAVGAYASALLVTKAGLSTWSALPLSGLTAAFFSLLIGYPIARAKAFYFAMGTFFFSAIIVLLLEGFRGFTGGTTGITNMPRPHTITMPGVFSIEFVSKVPCYYYVLFLASISLTIMYLVEKSRVGMAWKAIQQADFVAASLGINVTKYRILALATGCFFAGIAGAFYAHYLTSINPSGFNLFYMFYVLAYMVVGGKREFIGPIIGAVILTFIPELFAMLKQYQPFIFAAVLGLTAILLPDGLISLPVLIGRRLKRGREHA